MSVITDIILITGIGDSNYGPQPDYKAHNSAHELIKHADLKQVDGSAGGNRKMQCDIYMSANNHFDIVGLLKIFNETKWEYPECVQLLVKGEYDETFIIYTPSC